MLNGHIDPTFVHKYANTQQTAMSTSHVILIYVPEKIYPPY